MCVNLNRVIGIAGRISFINFAVVVVQLFGELGRFLHGRVGDVSHLLLSMQFNLSPNAAEFILKIPEHDAVSRCC